MFDAKSSATAWSREVFGALECGDARREARVRRMAARLGAEPRGRISEVFAVASEREAAYRQIRCDAWDAQALVRSARTAVVKRARELPFAYVALDGTSLNLGGPFSARELGRIGASQARGIEVMTGLALSPTGVPLGLVAQRHWIRSDRKHELPAVRRPLVEKESRHWLELVAEVSEAFAQSGARPWFQCDRGADIKELLAAAERGSYWLTVRCHANRRVIAPRRTMVRELLRELPAAGLHRVRVPARNGRPGRIATLEVRFQKVTAQSKNSWSKSRVSFALTLVEVREVSHAAAPLHWMLWTNREVKCVRDAIDVVEGYTCRWRIEEFHRAWKSILKVEDNQLRSLATISKWATLTAVTAARVEELKRLSREQPDRPASDTLSPDEIDATLLLRTPKSMPAGALTLSQLVRWIADLGGYNGKSSGGPPGSVVIARGLERVLLTAETLAALRAAGRLNEK